LSLQRPSPEYHFKADWLLWGHRYYREVQRINDWEPTVAALSDEELKNKTSIFKESLKQGRTLDELLPEAFAVVREATRRVLGQRHYDVQLVRECKLHETPLHSQCIGVPVWWMC
jgi:preprotein translocase subunit SecA